MDAKTNLAAHALALLEADGIGAFSTRLVCDRAGVKAPTLYHHFGSADGLVSAAVERGFEEFLLRKISRPVLSDPVADLMDGWDDYVAFARERPRLYAAMASRVLAGADIPAALAARQHLESNLDRLAASGLLTMPVSIAADVIWASAHSAAMLYVTRPDQAPDSVAIRALRQAALGVLATPPP